MNPQSVTRTNQPDREESFEELHTIRWEQNVKWKAGLSILFALALILAAQSWLSVFVLQEALVVVLGTAFFLLAIFLTLSIFLFLWQGACFLLDRLRRSVGRIPSVRERPVVLNRR